MVGWILLSPDLINSNSQVGVPGPEGPLVFVCSHNISERSVCAFTVNLDIFAGVLFSRSFVKI